MPSALNFAIDRAQGRYLARMDADDLLKPERFERQAAFLEQCPAVGILGSGVTLLGSGALIQMPSEHESIVRGLLFRGTLLHPTIMMRRDILESPVCRYNPAYRYAEDMELWMRLATRVRFANLQEPLVMRRKHRGMSTYRNNRKMDYLVLKLRQQLAGELAGEQNGRGPVGEKLALLMRNPRATVYNWTKWLGELERASRYSTARTPDQIGHILSSWRADTVKRLYLLKRQYYPSLFIRYLFDPDQPWRRTSLRISVIFFIKCIIFWKARSFI